MNRRNTPGCCDCIYFRGHCDESVCCNYIFDEDRIRPCPPGIGCTVKVERKEKDAESMTERRDDI